MKSKIEKVKYNFMDTAVWICLDDLIRLVAMCSGPFPCLLLITIYEMRFNDLEIYNLFWKHVIYFKFKFTSKSAQDEIIKL